MNYLKITKKEAVDWYVNNFNLREIGISSDKYIQNHAKSKFS
jgi:hypothetical protein